MGGYKQIKPRYKKGESGNPKGRPPVLPDLKAAIARCLAKEKDGLTALDTILDALGKRAAKGDVRAAQELMDRGFGKSTQIIAATIGSTKKDISDIFPTEEELNEEKKDK